MKMPRNVPSAPAAKAVSRTKRFSLVEVELGVVGELGLLKSSLELIVVGILFDLLKILSIFLWKHVYRAGRSFPEIYLIFLES